LYGWLPLAFAAVFLVCGCAARGKFTPPPLDELIQDIEKKSHLVENFRADFVKTRRIAAFKSDLTAQGRLVYLHTGGFRLTLTGDVEVEVLSNGTVLSVIHDMRDQEFRMMSGDRDSVPLSDPFILLMQEFGNGILRDCRLKYIDDENDAVVLEVLPGHSARLEIMDRALLWLTETGMVSKARIHYLNGNVDTFSFSSWEMLPADHPSLVTAQQSLATLDPAASEARSSTSSGIACCPTLLPPLTEPPPHFSDKQANSNNLALAMPAGKQDRTVQSHEGPKDESERIWLPGYW
jgi:hypothetical protein